MKSIYLFTVFALLTTSSIAQTWSGTTPGIIYYNQGNVGIGSVTPIAPLHVEASLFPQVRINNLVAGGESGIRIRSHETGAKDLHVDLVAQYSGTGDEQGKFHIRVPYTSPERLTIDHLGNVGISTTSPGDLLHVKGDNSGLRLSSSSYYGGAGGAKNQVISSIKFVNRDLNYNYRAEVRGILTADWAEHVGLAFTTNFQSQQVERMRINHDGTVGIGTADTFGYKLAVNGTIASKEVKVENTSPWPDFVFESNYDLRTLEEVETYISENKHLPEIPSKAEVTEKGINLGEMDAKLLQKIEELTLYMIEINKRVGQLEQENGELKKELSDLKKE
ncbi:MAG: hypothetical protein RLN81_02915 [Balneolaceae bacterium]